MTSDLSNKEMLRKIEALRHWRRNEECYDETGSHWDEDDLTEAFIHSGEDVDFLLNYICELRVKNRRLKKKNKIFRMKKKNRKLRRKYKELQKKTNTVDTPEPVISPLEPEVEISTPIEIDSKSD